MKALIYENNHLKLDKNFPKPERKPGEVLIRVLTAGICSTDLEIMKGYKNFSGVLGHEFIGVVEEADKSDLKGKRVAGEINCGCGQCEYCLRGNPAHCPHRTVPGILGRNGTMAEYCVLPKENIHVVPDTLPTREAVFAEPLAAALAITRDVHIKPTASVLVIGDGKLGLLIAQVLKLTGCSLLVAGRHPEKLNILEKMDIAVCLEKELFLPEKTDIVVECTGTPQGAVRAVEYVKPGGHIILKSTFKGSGSLDLTSLVVNEITLTGSRCGPFAPALRLLARKLVHTAPLLDREFPLDQGIDAFAYAAEKGRLKVLITPAPPG